MPIKCVFSRNAAPSMDPAICFVASISFLFLTQVVPANEGLEPPNSTLQRATELLPDTTVAFAHIPSAGTLVDAILNHHLRPRIESLPDVAQAKKSKEFTAFLGGVALFEASMTMPWPEVVDSLTEQGLFVAVDAATDGVVALAKGSDQATTTRFIETVVSTVKIVGGSNAEVKEVEYDRFHAYAIGDLKIAQLDDWLLVTNKSDLGKAILDRYIEITGEPQTTRSASFRQHATFQTALDDRPDAAGWAFLDLAAVRESGTAPKLYSGASENILAEAIFGGILSSLAKTPHAIVQLTVDSGDLGLSIHLPHEADWIGQREYFFGPNNEGVAPSHIVVNEQIASLTAYRDLAEMWLRAGDLLIEKAADELATADSTLSTFFSGRDFGEDILGGLAPEIQLVIREQNFSDAMPKPVIKLPSFALQFKMLDPQKMRPDMRRVFISLFGFLNVVGAMEGQPQLDFAIDSHGQAEIIATHYLPPDKENAAPGNTYEAAAINYNFSPSVGFVDDRIIISSSSALAEELLNLDAPSSSAANLDANTSIKLWVPPIVTTLQNNREQLVTQNMLEKGHERDAAESEIDLLLNLLALVKDAKLELTTHKDLVITFGVRFEAD